MIRMRDTGWAVGVVAALFIVALFVSTAAARTASASEAWAESRTGMEFVWVPGGCFQMGCGPWSKDCDLEELPAHQVCVDGFWMGKYVVSQSQWEKIMGSNPSRFKGPNNPVERVSWQDAQEFISRLNSQNFATGFRLPTEAQWEYACRSGGRQEKYCGGNNVDSVAWNSGNSGLRTHPVGLKSPNGLGLYDMSGNVGEWCEDAWDPETYSNPGSNPHAANTADRVLRSVRGGNWGYAPRHVRSTFRDWYAEDARYDDLGFRVAISAWH